MAGALVSLSGMHAGRRHVPTIITTRTVEIEAASSGERSNDLFLLP